MVQQLIVHFLRQIAVRKLYSMLETVEVAAAAAEMNVERTSRRTNNIITNAEISNMRTKPAELGFWGDVTHLL